MQVRDKYGDRRSYKATFVVTQPNGENFTAIQTVKYSEMCAVTFPEDFGQETRGLPGITKWSAYVDNELVGYGEFEYRAVRSFLDNLTIRRNNIEMPASHRKAN